MTAERRYLLLGLRLGRHVDGLVDAYYGPPELAEQANAGEPVAAAALAEEADALLAEVPDGWLADQLRGLSTCARVLAGEPIGYADEVERCYGVRPVRTDEAVYAAAHEALDDLLPGDGSLLERREAWKTRNRLDGERLFPLLRDLLADLRRRTIEAFGLPEDEEIVLEPVDGEPWWAFNYYLGGRRSRVVVNTDVPTTVQDAIHLAAHEVYPGHHTEHAWKERLFVEERGELGESIMLVPTPQSLLSEGIAETGGEVLLDEQGRAEMAAIVARHGVTYDPERAHAIVEAVAPLSTVQLDAALMIHEEGRSRQEAQAYVERWALVTPERASHQLDFVTDPTWRAYVVCYSAGETLCRAWVGGDRDRFRRLLTEQVRVRELSSTR
ncbi:MAG TPA: hypothetical protein VF186_08845 [Gaiellaceae bacterium]